jgi:uncharacterized RDD family membrane protein YckC
MAMEPMRDQLNIDTPELVAIELPLAGIGSRFIAILIDYLIWGAAFFILLLLMLFVISSLHVFDTLSSNWAVGVFILIVFLMQWGYFTLFEALNNGRTPGKSLAKIRVIHQSGRGISFVESLGRNLVRAIDYMPGFYAVGVLSIFLTKRNQRLGDLVAGTLVVRDRETEAPAWAGATSRTFTGPALAADMPIPPPHLQVVLPATALAKLSVSDLEVLEGFFTRRLDMDLQTRAALAGRISAALCAKSGLTLPADVSVETFLEAVAHQLREIGRMR